MGHKKVTQRKLGQGFIKSRFVSRMENSAKLRPPGDMPAAEITPDFRGTLITGCFPPVQFSEKIELDRNVVFRLGICGVLVESIFFRFWFAYLLLLDPLDQGF